MEIDLHLVKIDMHQFLTVRADFGALTVKIDRISTAWTTRDDNADYLSSLLHVNKVLSKKRLKFSRK
jgi:hypothetical protein